LNVAAASGVRQARFDGVAFFTIPLLAQYGIEVPWPWVWILLPLALLIQKR
jgi:hypothetical protein